MIEVVYRSADIWNRAELTFPSIDGFHISQSLMRIARKPRQHHGRSHIHGQVRAMFIVRDWTISHLWRV